MSWLTELSLRQIGPFDGETVPLSPCTVLVGPNGSGKSTILRAISYLAEPESAGRAHKFRAFNATTRLTGDEEEGQYGWTSGMGIFRGGTLHTGGARDATYKRYLKGVRLYDIAGFNLRGEGPVAQGNVLLPDASNLVSVIDAVRDKADGSYEQLQGIVRSLLHPVTGISMGPGSEAGRKTITALHENGRQVPFAELSTGVRTVITLATILSCDLDATCMLLEEPEQGLHPAVIGPLVDSLMRLVRTPDNPDGVISQLIMTTHSPWVYSRFAASPEGIVCLNHVDGKIKAKRLTEMDEWETIFSNGELLPLRDLSSLPGPLGDILRNPS